MSKRPGNRAVFMDRDGTLSEEMGYVRQASDYRPFPWSGEAVRKINESGMKAILTTNQSGIARGYFNESTLEEIHTVLQEELARWDGHLDAIYFCPHHPEAGCDCRKPRPGMLLRASREMDIDLAGSFMIGDRYLDIKTAHAVGVRSVLVCSGDGRSELEKYAGVAGPQPDYIAENVLEAVEAILSGRVQ